jgi:hypothetical protein
MFYITKIFQYIIKKLIKLTFFQNINIIILFSF